MDDFGWGCKKWKQKIWVKFLHVALFVTSLHSGNLNYRVMPSETFYFSFLQAAAVNISNVFSKVYSDWLLKKGKLESL